MKKDASKISGDQPKKADFNKLPSPEPGQYVHQLNGSAYRVKSKLAGPDGIVLKLANLHGKPVPTPANFHPVGSSMTRLASWLRYHLAYNRDFDMYVNAYIDQYNENHPDSPLPYPVGKDGKPFRWADWFQSIVSPKLHVHATGVEAQALKDEAIHEMLFTVLGQRQILEQFGEKIKNFSAETQKLALAQQLTSFLVSSFMYRIDEMRNKLQSRNETMGGSTERAIEYQKSLLNKATTKKERSEIQKKIDELQKQIDEMGEYKDAPREMSMWLPSVSEEGEEMNVLEMEEHGVGEEEFQSAEAKKDIAKFRQGFTKWLTKGSAAGPDSAANYTFLFDLFWVMISNPQADTNRSGGFVNQIQTAWMKRTGLSAASFKKHLYELPELMEKYITSHRTELGEKNIFVDLMNAISAERFQRLRRERREKEKAKAKARPAAAPAMASLNLASVEGDIAEALSETVNPDSIDKDIHQQTVGLSEAAKVSAEETNIVAAIRPGDRVTILVPAGMGRNGQEWKEATGVAVMRSSTGGWVLNMGGRHGTPGLADEKNIVRVKPAKRGSKTAAEVVTNHGTMSYEASDVVNPDDFIPNGQSNPHKVRPFLIHNEFGTLAIVYASNEQDALDEAVDHDKMDSCMVSPEDMEEAEAEGHAEEYAFLGNAGEPFDLTYVGLIPLPNQQYGVSEIETDAMLEGMDKGVGEEYDKNFLKNLRIQGSKTAGGFTAGGNLTPEQIEQVKQQFVYRWTKENPTRVKNYPCDMCDVANEPYVNTVSAEGHPHPTIPLQSDDEWISEHAFYFLNDGRLAPKKHAVPAYLAQHNARHVSSVGLKFAIEKAAYNPGTEGQLPCCGGWHGMHRSNCSVKEQKDTETINMLKALPKRSASITNCKNCAEPIGYATDDPAYQDIAGWTHHPEDGPDAYVYCGDEYGTDAEPPESFLLKTSMLPHDFDDADGQAIRNETMPDTGRIPHASDQAELKPRMGAGSNSGNDDARGAGDLWREEFYERGEKGPSAKALFGADETDEDPMMVAKTILEQLGGRKFIAMTGAKNLVGGANSLSFKLPGSGGYTKNGINGVRIELTPNDTYKVTFLRARGGKVTTVSEHDDVYVDSLREIFERETGLRTSLGRMAADKTADTLTSQTQNVNMSGTPGKSEPMAVPEAIDQTPGPHSPNAPATAPRTPGIQPKVVNVPAGTQQEDMMKSSSAKFRCDDCGTWSHISSKVATAEGDEICTHCAAEGLGVPSTIEEAILKFGFSPSKEPGLYNREEWTLDVKPDGNWQLRRGGEAISKGRDFGSMKFVLNESFKPRGFHEAAVVQQQAQPAPAKPVLPNVVQNQNIVRPGQPMQQPGAAVAIMPGQEDEQEMSRHTVEPELPNAKYHMMSALVMAEEARLAKAAGLNTFKVTFEDGNSLVTDFNGTLEEAEEYYLNNEFNFGDTEMNPKDHLVRGVSVEQV